MSEKLELLIEVDNRKAINKVKDFDRATDKIGSTTQKTGGILSSVWTKIGISISGVALAMKSLMDGAKTIDTLKTRLKVAMGSAEAMESKFSLLNDMTNKMGLSMETTINAYSGFKIASDLAGTSAEDTEKIFSSLITASGAMKLSADDTMGAFKALEQMMSKGTVQSEELRGQLGERIPGAFSMAAEAMGVTTMELGKMLEQGQVLSKDLLPKLADVLQNKFAQGALDASNSIQASYNRLGNSFTDFKDIVLDAFNEMGIVDYFAGAVKGLKDFTKELKISMRDVSQLETIDDLNMKVDQLIEKRKELEKGNFLGYVDEGALRKNTQKLQLISSKMNKIYIKEKSESEELVKINEEKVALEKAQIKKQDVERKLEAEREYQLSLDALDKAGIKFALSNNQKKLEAEKQLNADILAEKQLNAELIADLDQAGTDFALNNIERIKKAKERQTKKDEQLKEQELKMESEAVDGFLQLGATLSSATEVENEKEFKSKKALNTALAIANTARAVTTALKNPPLAAAIGAMGAIQVAQIQATQYQPKELGGAVGKDRPYLVGEKGAEMFVPNAHGTIVPNKNLGGGNTTIQMVVNAPNVVDQQGLIKLLESSTVKKSLLKTVANRNNI